MPSRGCAQFNPFGEGTLTPECAAAISINATNIFDLTQTNFVAAVTGSLFTLPAGDVKFAIGAEYRDNDATFRPDEYLASGDVVGFNAAQPVSGKIDVTEGFAELSVPLLHELPLVQDAGPRPGVSLLQVQHRGRRGHVQGGAAVEPRGNRERPRVVQPRHPRAEHRGAVPAAAGELSAVLRPLQLQLELPHGPQRRAGGGVVRSAGNSRQSPAYLHAAQQPGAFVHRGQPGAGAGDRRHVHVRHHVAVRRGGGMGAQPEHFARLLPL